MRSRNFLNSTARWRAVSWWVTMPVARFNAAYKVEGAVADVVMGLAGGHARAHREGRSGPVERLHLRLFVRTKDKGRLVGSDQGAVPAFQPVRFPGPPSEPDVRVSTHPALHVTMPLATRRPGFVAHGEGMAAPR